MAADAQASQLRLLTEIIQSINSGNSLDDVFDLLYGGLSALVPYNRIAVALVDENKELLTILASKSDGAMVLRKGYSGRIAGSSLEPLLREGSTRILNDLEQYLAQKPGSDSTRLIVREGMRSSLTLPLQAQGQAIGVMFFSSRKPNTYRPEHEEFLRNIAGHMALAIERTRLIDTLRERSSYLENILQNSVDAIVVLDENNRIRSWNEGAQRMFGYTSEEILGKEYSIFVPSEDREAGEVAKLKERVEKEGFLKDYECARIAKDGRRLVVNVTSTLLRDRNGRIIGRSSIVRDVTRLRSLQEDLARTQSLAAVGELAAQIAHEIKNPLAGISGAIQVLADAIPDADPRKSVVPEILAQIARLDNTVRDLLTFARPMTPARLPVRIAETLTRAWSLLSSQPGVAAVRFEVRGDATVPADPDLLHQVWINLFQNAIEAMPRGGSLEIDLRDGDPVSVRVRDTGTGVDPQHAGRVFRPFFSTKARGTGLGLAISRKIVEAHSGTIRLQSAPGRGTTVFVEIPR